jgi:endoglucanase
VRIPIRWSAHAGQSAPYTIDEAFFERIDWAVEQALSRDLLVVVNMHHYEEIFSKPSEHEERFLVLWAQIAAHYQDYPPELLFEILNEPHNVLTASRWNGLLVKALDVVRPTNPNRNVVIGPGSWNNVNVLRHLELPADDRHIIVTFHYYEPFSFTHQGADWADGSESWLGRTWTGTEQQRSSISRDMDVAATWAEANDRPLYLGEFGAYSKADMESRALWTSFVARQAEERGMSWAYWEFCAGFGVFDLTLDRWNEELFNALVPEEMP